MNGFYLIFHWRIQGSESMSLSMKVDLLFPKPSDLPVLETAEASQLAPSPDHCRNADYKEGSVSSSCLCLNIPRLGTSVTPLQYDTNSSVSWCFFSQMWQRTHCLFCSMSVFWSYPCLQSDITVTNISWFDDLFYWVDKLHVHKESIVGVLRVTGAGAAR